MKYVMFSLTMKNNQSKHIPFWLIHKNKYLFL